MNGEAIELKIGEIEKVLKEISSTERNGFKTVKATILIGITVVGALLALGKWEVEKEVKPLEIQIVDSKEKLIRFESKIDLILDKIGMIDKRVAVLANRIEGDIHD